MRDRLGAPKPLHLVIQQDPLRLMCGLALMSERYGVPVFPMITDTRAEVSCRNCLRGIEMSRPKLATVDGERV